MFATVLHSFARMNIMVVAAFKQFRGMTTLLDQNGELRPSLTTMQQLLKAQAILAEKLGLTPTTLQAVRGLASQQVFDLDRLNSTLQARYGAKGSPGLGASPNDMPGNGSAPPMNGLDDDADVE
jgi:hypothetical protein